MTAQASFDEPEFALRRELESAIAFCRAAAPSIPARIGEYELGVSIGRGGMAEVFLAHHVETGRPVAIKILRPALALDEEAVERFRREAASASSLRGPHSVRVYAVGATASGLPFIMMEYLVGTDLQAVVDRGPLSVRDAIRWMREACEAVAEAHARGVIHRDLKPSNLFIADTPRGRILKILDYGIARAATNAPRLTATHTAVGTPLYMSPEQARNSKTIDHRTDVWSLGVILYELLTGRVPFEGDSPTEIAIRLCTQTPPPPSTLRDGIPPELSNIVLWALAKDPDDRPADVTELAIALRLVSIPEEPSAPLPIVADFPIPEVLPPPPPPPSPPVSWLRVRRMPESVGLVLAGTLVLSLGFLASPLEMDRTTQPLQAATAAPRIVGVTPSQRDTSSNTAPSSSAGTPRRLREPKSKATSVPPRFDETPD